MKSVVYETIRVDNVKCPGCASTIEKELLLLNGVEFVKVDFEHGSVRIMFNALEMDAREGAINRLKQLGYPLEGTSTKLDQAKSYISCALGKFGGDHDHSISEPSTP